MKFRSHINLAIALFCGGIFLVHSLLPHFSSLPVGDIPLSLSLVLIGAGLVDIDLWWKGPGHRVTSFFHMLEAPWIAGAFFAVLSIIPAWYLPGFLRRFWAPFFHSMTLLCAGWFFHLIGDVIEGGIWSMTLRRRVGIVWFKWNRYDGTWLGNLVNLVVALSAVFAAYRVMSAVYYSGDAMCVRFFPDMVNSAAGWNIPPMSGVLLIPALWGICMMWGRGGFRGFFWRLFFLSAGIVGAAFVFLRHNPFR